jgi:hypothetical protein
MATAREDVMVNTKDLRDMFDELAKEAGKRASHALDDVNIGRQSGPPGLLIFCIGLSVGAAIGLVAAFLSTPFNGAQARAKLTEQVEKVRHKEPEEIGANGTPAYATPTAFERSLS